MLHKYLYLLFIVCLAGCGIGAITIVVVGDIIWNAYIIPLINGKRFLIKEAAVAFKYFPHKDKKRDTNYFFLIGMNRVGLSAAVHHQVVAKNYRKNG